MRCNECGHALPEGSRFCPQCGQRVDPYRGRYHPVTVLFVDLSGYTRLMLSHTPEHLQPYLLQHPHYGVFFSGVV